MTGLLGALVAWAGYLFVTYGWSEIRGGTNGLGEMAWPGKWQSWSKAAGPTTGPGGCAADEVYDGQTGKCIKSGSTVPLTLP